MNKQFRKITKTDLIPLEEYSKKRKAIRKEIVNYKKNRRVSLGPYANFYFESFKTMKAQIQEMLYIEKGGDDQLKDELAAYNPLVPNGNELVATLMFEIDNPTLRLDFLNKVGGIEEKVYIQIGSDKINSIPEKDLDRTSSEGKASSVQFLHFNFSGQQIKNFKDIKNEIIIGINHESYNHMTTISEDTRNALIEDFI
tara:strand:+ start:1089 stop:1682 length:594 start_codon:yes stop_codon:yes gene_type:complete